MNIHQFNVKPKHKPHKTIKWIIPQDVKYPAKKVNSITWEIFSQALIDGSAIQIQDLVKKLNTGMGIKKI